MKTSINQLKAMADRNDENTEVYLKKLVSEAKSKNDVETLNKLAKILMDSASVSLDTIEDSIAEYSIQQKMSELYNAINLSYIARCYFGKSRSWLYQRIKGYNVNGKKAKFTQDEKQVFINALNDIKNKIEALNL